MHGSHSSVPPSDPRPVDLPDLPYLSLGGSAEHDEARHLDIYLPDGIAPASGYPALIWFHGGGLESGSRRDPVLARRMTKQGFLVAMAGYRLSPRVGYPAYVADAAAAVATLLAHAKSLCCDPRAIFVGGVSAGAYLAAMLALDRRRLNEVAVLEEQVAGYILVSGQMTTHFTVRRERGNWNGLAVCADEAAPIHHIRGDSRPMLLLVGDRDLPARLEENRFFAAAMTGIAANPNVSLEVIADRDHGAIGSRLFEPGDSAGPRITAFMQTCRAGNTASTGS